MPQATLYHNISTASRPNYFGIIQCSYWFQSSYQLAHVRLNDIKYEKHLNERHCLLFNCNAKRNTEKSSILIQPLDIRIRSSIMNLICSFPKVNVHCLQSRYLFYQIFALLYSTMVRVATGLRIGSLHTLIGYYYCTTYIHVYANEICCHLNILNSKRG